MTNSQSITVNLATEVNDLSQTSDPEHYSATMKEQTLEVFSQIPFPIGEPVAQAIKDHQTSLEDWPYSVLISELHHWVEIFDFEFKLKLPSYPVIKFASLRNAYAKYGWSRDEIGTKDNITFNTKELSRDPALTLRTLLHELLHLWQHYHGTPGKRNYHNKEFCNKALECGLLVDRWGCTNGHNEIFTDILAKHGIHLDPIVTEIRLWGSRKRVQKMKKWSCHCTNVRCATKLRAKCILCGELFVLS